MSRTEGNPFKRKEVRFAPKRTTVIVLSFIPHLRGYFSERLEILQVCLLSILKHTDRPFNLMVVDNGSCSQVVKYLVDMKQKGLIQHLLLHHENLGYGYALSMAFQAALGEYVAFSNDDVFFYPNWLSNQIAILEAFPKVGFVGGQPIVGHPAAKLAPTIASQLGLSLQDYTPPFEWVKEWAHSLGTTLEDLLSDPYVKGEKLYLLRSKGITAVTGCTGYQYTFKRALLVDLPPLLKGLGVGPEDQHWHQAADNRGYLNLNTVERFTLHLGNELDCLDHSLLEEYGIELPSPWRSLWKYRVRKFLNIIRTVYRIPKLSQIVKFLYQKLRDFN